MGEFKKNFIRICTVLIVFSYLLFLYLDISTKDLGNKTSLYLKYSIILLCFLITLFIGRNGFGRKDRFLVQAARFFTVVADYFMVIKDENKLGIITFCLVQVIYIIRHTEVTGRKISIISLIKLAIIPGIIMIFVGRFHLKEMDLMILGLIYACFLLTSLYCALTVKNKKLYSPLEAGIIAAGMALFFLCDLNVGLYALTDKFAFGFLIWIFYAPSQLLLVLSGFREACLNKVFFTKG